MASNCSNSTGDSYIGSFISLISKYEIRYEGVLYLLSVQDSTIGLKNVRSYGTEGRKKDGSQIPSSDKVYEFILFRGSDIKDLQVKTSPPAQTEQPVHDDPAIIQSHYAGVPASSSASAMLDGKTLAESAQGKDLPALTGRPHSTALTSFQSVNHVGSTNLSHAPENTGQSFSMPSFQSVNHVGSANLSQAPENTSQSFFMPMYLQGHDGTSINRSHAPHHSIALQLPSLVSSSLSVHNQMQALGLGNSPIVSANVSEFVTPVSFVASDFLHPNFATSGPVRYSVSHDMPSSSSVKTSLPPHAAYASVDTLTTASIPYSSEDIGISNAQNVREAVSESLAVHPTQSMLYPVYSYGAYTSSPLLTPTPSLSSPEQLAQSRSHVLSSLMYPNQKNMDSLTPLSSAAPPLIPSPASQEPLLPLPGSVQKFTEEFDFEAMNEKFKKDEVWGYLGKAKQRDKTEVAEDNGIDQSLEDKEAPRLVPNFDATPAYKKDDFFDTISCNSLSQQRNGQNRFSDRFKQDTETFGWYNQRPNMGYGSCGPGRGNNYRGRHNWGRGYGYGGLPVVSAGLIFYLLRQKEMFSRYNDNDISTI